MRHSDAALYLTGKQSRSFANSTGPEYRFLISDRVWSSFPKVRSIRWDKTRCLTCAFSAICPITDGGMCRFLSIPVAPSGTALKLRDLMSEHLGPDIPTSSTRAGYIPGTHRVGFDSEADQVLLTHTARSRQGFASGAVLAAHWIVGRTGVFEFGEVMEEILNRRSP